MFVPEPNNIMSVPAPKIPASMAGEVTSFDSTKLAHVKTEDKVVLPTQEGEQLEGFLDIFIVYCPFAKLIIKQ